MWCSRTRVVLLGTLAEDSLVGLLLLATSDGISPIMS